MRTQRWELRLTEEELIAWKQKAADEGMLLAEWVRENCNENLDRPVGRVEDHRAEELPRARGATSGERSTGAAVRSSKPKKTCTHGTEKGYACWQCGGLAVVNGE